MASLTRVILSTLALLSPSIAGPATAGNADPHSGYFQKLRDLSFDMRMMHEYPVAWQTTGTAIPLMSKTKLVPAIPKVNG